MKFLMKKRLTLVLFCAAFATVSPAQTVDEWLRQKVTQKKYLLKQIAALQVYIEFLQKGYSIAKDGLTLMGNVKKGEFELHSNYFASLKNVNPTIRSYGRVTDIIRLQTIIVQRCRKDYRQAQKSGAFTADETTYIRRVYDRVLADCNRTLDELLTVTTDGKLELTDDQRMSRIDALYGEIQGQHTFLRSFSHQTMLLASSRVQMKNEAKTVRTLYGLSSQ